MMLHQVDAYPLDTTGCGHTGEWDGDGQHYIFSDGDGDMHGDGDGDGTGMDEPYERELVRVVMCVSQMYLLAQLLNINQGE